MEKWPSVVRSMLPFGLGPKGSTLVPAWSTVSDTMVHTPTNCCLSLPIFWLPAPRAAKATTASVAGAGRADRMIVLICVPLSRAMRRHDRRDSSTSRVKWATRPFVLLARFGRGCGRPAFLDALPRHRDGDRAHRGGLVDELELVPRQLDRPLLVRSDPVREAAALEVHGQRLARVLHRLR